MRAVIFIHTIRVLAVWSVLDPYFEEKKGRIRFRAEHPDLKSLYNRTFPSLVIDQSYNKELINFILRFYLKKKLSRSFY